MKLLIHQIPKHLFCFLGCGYIAFSQYQLDVDTTPCDLIFKKASKQYQVVFNYDYQEIKNIECLEGLPKTLNEFIKVVTEYSGLTFEPFSKSIWIVKKNFTHQIKCLDLNNNPLVGVYDVNRKLLSNQYGNIFLKINNFPKTIEFKFLDFDSQSIEIEKNSSNTIYLNMFQYNLPEIIIDNLYIKGIYLDQNKHIKLKTKYIPLLAGQVQQDAMISLLNLPQISTSSESVAEINIKGGVNDQNLVLWNGIKMFQNGHFFGLLSAFNYNLIETISVIDNATPAQHGNALSGTIKLDFDENFSTKNTYGFGANALSGHAFLKQKITKDIEFSFAIQKSFTNLFNTPTFNAYSQKVYNDTEIELEENQNTENKVVRDDVFSFQDAQFQFKKKFSNKLKISLNGIWFQNHLNYIERIDENNSKNSSFENLNVAMGLNAKYDWNQNNSFFVLYNVSNHQSNGNNNTFTGNLNTVQSNVVDNYFFQLYWKKTSEKYKLNVGLDYEGCLVSNRFNNSITSAFLNLFQISNLYATFADLTYQNNAWHIFGGVRNSYYQRDAKIKIEPRLNVSYQINESLEVSLRGEMKSQNLRQIIDLDQNFLGIEKRRWLLSGENELQLQDSKQIETIFKFSQNKLGGYVSLFLRQLNGLSSNDQQFLNQNQFSLFQNGSSNIKGAMLHLFYKDKTINSWMSFAYLNEKISTPSLTFIGNNNLNYHITWGNNIRYRNWNFSLSCIFHDGLTYTSINETMPLKSNFNNQIQSINYNEPNNSKLPNYFRIDSSLQYEIKTKSNEIFKFSFGVINLANQTNIMRRNFRLNRVDSNQIQKIETLGLGFTPNIGILAVF